MIKSSKDTWVYQKDGRDLIKGSYQKVSGKKSLTIVVDPVLTNQMPLQLICLERGTDAITNNSAMGTAIIIGIMLGVLRVVASGSQQ